MDTTITLTRRYLDDEWRIQGSHDDVYCDRVKNGLFNIPDQARQIFIKVCDTKSSGCVPGFLSFSRHRAPSAYITVHIPGTVWGPDNAVIEDRETVNNLRRLAGRGTEWGIPIYLTAEYSLDRPDNL